MSKVKVISNKVLIEVDSKTANRNVLLLGQYPHEVKDGLVRLLVDETIINQLDTAERLEPEHYFGFEPVIPVVRNNDGKCGHCHFASLSREECNKIKCMTEERSDRLSVIFELPESPLLSE